MSCFIENLSVILELAYPLRFFMYPWGYAYPRLGTAALEHVKYNYFGIFNYKCIPRVYMIPFKSSMPMKIKSISQECKSKTDLLGLLDELQEI